MTKEELAELDNTQRILLGIKNEIGGISLTLFIIMVTLIVQTCSGS